MIQGKLQYTDLILTEDVTACDTCVYRASGIPAFSIRNRVVAETPPEGYSVKEHDTLFSWCLLFSGPKQDAMLSSH
jgi:hypothetical protein